MKQLGHTLNAQQCTCLSSALTFPHVPGRFSKVEVGDVADRGTRRVRPEGLKAIVQLQVKTRATRREKAKDLELKWLWSALFFYVNAVFALSCPSAFLGLQVL